MKSFLVRKYYNEITQEEFLTTAESFESLQGRLAPNSLIRFGNCAISSIKLKGTDIRVYISSDGVFFYFDINGEEVILDNLDYNWLLEPVGAYHSKILSELDVETIEIEPQ